MMGQQARTESLFHYFHLEDQIPQDHQWRSLSKLRTQGMKAIDGLSSRLVPVCWVVEQGEQVPMAATVH